MRANILIFILLTCVRFSFAQDTSDYFHIYSSKKTFDNTEQFIKAFKQGKPILIHPGTYHVKYNTQIKSNRIEIYGLKEVDIYGIGSPTYKSIKPHSIFSIINPKKVIVSNINFCGHNNVAVALGIYITDYTRKTETKIIVTNNKTEEIGLIWVGPKKGFTFNRINSPYVNWGQSGPIYQNNWNSNITISNNHCMGDPFYKSGNFKNSSVSAISLLYANNASVYANEIDNFRFGIWSYGGASRTADKKELSNNPILCNNIKVYNNTIKETYSPIWFSKTSNIDVHNNVTVNNQDVALDVEGCKGAVFYENSVKNSRGGALVALNGSENILFKNNTISLKNYNRQNNIVLIRDGNKNISYINNRFTFKDSRLFPIHARVFIKKTSNLINDNRGIIFRGNTFKNIDFEIRDKSSVERINNQFKF